MNLTERQDAFEERLRKLRREQELLRDATVAYEARQRRKGKVSKDSGGSSSGMGFMSWLQLLFIGLKLTGFIDWSWWWVLAPTWMTAALALFVVLVYLVFFHRSRP